MEAYLVIVLLQPTNKQKHDDGAVATIVVPVQAVVAKDEANALAKALKLVPQEHADKDDRLEPRVIPFGKSAR